MNNTDELYPTDPTVPRKGMEIDSDPISLLVVSVADAKTFLSVNHSEHDILIEDFIKSATKDIEDYTHRAIEERSHSVYWREIHDRFLELPRPPHSSIDSVTRIDRNGNDTTLTSDDYYEYGEKQKSIRLKSFSTDAVKIGYTAGYGTGVDDIPQGLKTAVKWQIKLYYNNRNTGQDDFVEVDQPSGLVVQAKVAADDFVFYYEAP